MSERDDTLRKWMIFYFECDNEERLIAKYMALSKKHPRQPTRARPGRRWWWIHPAVAGAFGLLSAAGSRYALDLNPAAGCPVIGMALGAVMQLYVSTVELAPIIIGEQM